jgi:hypothetical protein
MLIDMKNLLKQDPIRIFKYLALLLNVKDGGSRLAVTKMVSGPADG